MKTFKHLKPEHLAGLSWWFWFRENISYMNRAASEIYSDYWNCWPGRNVKEWAIFIFGIPAGYIVGLVIGPYYRKEDAKESSTNKHGVIMYNKRTISYFTLLAMLSGNK
jgi:hypothetical protein